MPSAIAIGAHPDDIEFFMAGTLVALRDAGYEIHYMNVANGSVGTIEHDATTIIRIRRNEAMAAAAMIGATYHESLTNDIEIFYDKPTLARLASVIREVAPRIVLTHSPADYMEDHTNTCRLAVTAAFCRGMRNFPVDPPRPVTHHTVAIYHAQPYGNCDPLRRPVRPEIFVDVGDKIDLLVEMLAKHQSQKDWLDQSQGLDSYLETLKDLAHEVGEMSGQYQYAQGWRRHLHLGFGGPEEDPLVAALGDRVWVDERLGN